MDEPIVQSRAAPGRSCIACSKRKIRCSRGQPCSYCTKLRVQCVYPGPSQEVKRQADGDVLARLKRIEISLLRLESRGASGDSPQSQAETFQLSNNTPENFDRDRESRLSTVVGSGKLVHEEGDTRYVTSSFWADLEEQDKDDALETEQSTADPSSVPSNSIGEPHQSFMFGFSSTSTDLHRFHPTENRIFTLWQVFLESVDPLLKILHVPMTQRQILRASQNLDAIPPAFECLMFSIYYAAVTSFQCSVSCQTLLQEERQTLLDRYRFGVEQSLARASFMSNPDVPTLQALTLYLICARQACDKTYVWTMTGLAIRLATKLGLHRDPVALGLSPFMSELRRRLWWQICILDVRTAEDNDMDPFICEHNFDTKFPSYVNDAALDINMTQPVKEGRNRTEMLFSLTRFEISYAARKLVFSPKFTHDNGYASMSTVEKNNLIESVQKALEEKYLNQCDSEIPICFLAATASRMVLAKMKLTINHPARIGSSGLSQKLFVDLIESSIEIIEYAHTLRTSEKYSQWVWLFQKYIEWDAVAFLLHSLCAVQLPSLIDRAWKAVDCFFNVWQGHVPEGERRWRRLESLRAKAVAKCATKEAKAIVPATSDTSTSAASVEIPLQDTGADLSSQPGRHRQGGEFELPMTYLSGGFGGTPGCPLSGGSVNSADLTTSLEQDPGSQNAGDFVDWSFDTIPYAMHGAPSWEMDVDESAFNSWLYMTQENRK